jgi:hypothetical protein
MAFLGATCDRLAQLDLSWCHVSNAEIQAFCDQPLYPPLSSLRLGVRFGAFVYAIPQNCTRSWSMPFFQQGGEMLSDQSMDLITAKFGATLEEIDLLSSFTVTNE